MSKKLEANITCPHCGHTFKMELYRSIWGEYPENKELVLSDKINVAHCPKCNKDTKLEFSLLYTNTPKKIAVWWEPHFDPQVEKDENAYKMVAPDSHLANAPRIKDWNEFKNKIIELEKDNINFKSTDIPNKKTTNTISKQSNDVITNNAKYSVDIKLTLTALLFLALTLLDYKKCRYYDNFCYNFPYGFYEILKFVICGYFSYQAYLFYQKSKIQFSFIISLILAIIYNPLMKISFAKDEWHFINIITIIIILLLSKSEFIKIYKKYQEKKERESDEAFQSVEKIVLEKLKNDPMGLQHLYEIKKNSPDKYKPYVYMLLINQSIQKKIDDDIAKNEIIKTDTINKQKQDAQKTNIKKVSPFKMQEISEAIQRYSNKQSFNIEEFFSLFPSLSLEKGYKLVSFKDDYIFYPYIKKNNAKTIKTYDEYKLKNSSIEKNANFASGCDKIIFEKTPNAYMEFLAFNYYVKLFFFEKDAYGGKLILTERCKINLVKRKDFGYQYTEEEQNKLLSTPIPTECSYLPDGSVVMSLIETNASFEILINKYKITPDNQIILENTEILTNYKFLF